jgi:hypothetical protein
MSLDEDLERGAQAARIVSSPIFDTAFKSVEQSIHDAWSVCPVRDREGAHELRLMLKLLGDVRAVLETCIEDGQSAKAEIERLQRKELSPRDFKGIV